ncbi:MAG: T9SS type A sorting domain-containing protein [Candidatus Cloacimonetes bacterium]|nr:T9SS type A sorting domain-containing protein [Candidatus Cloacimonadota bacterium]
MRKSVLVCVWVLTILASGLMATDPLKLHISNLKYGPGTGPVMFSNVQAYVAYFQDAGTSSYGVFENVDFLDGVAGLSFEVDNGLLTNFRHINTVDPDGDPTAPGEAGDRRIYTGATGLIKLNNIVKLSIDNIFVSSDISYPAPYGTGAPSVGQGYGYIKPNECDPVWLNYFDPYHTGIIHFDFTSFSQIVQGEYGLYDFDCIIRASNYQQYMRVLNITNLNMDYMFPDTGITMNFSAFTADHPLHPNSYTSNTFMVNRIEKIPGGILPSGINRLSNVYWEIGTTAFSFTGNLKIDLSTIAGISNPENLRLLYRRWYGANWQLVNHTLEGNNLIYNNLMAEGEFVIGTIGDDTLPVQLSSFSAVVNTDNQVNVKWTTQSETNLIGYHIYRNHSQNLETAERISNSIINAANQSIEHQYSYIDYDVVSGNTYYYWLKSIESDGSIEYFGPVQIKISDDDQIISITEVTDMMNAYPNPAKSTVETHFDIRVKTGETANLKIFNIKGQLVREYSSIEAGTHNLVWDKKDYHKQTCKTGIYFYQLTSPSCSSIKKMLIID